MNAVNATQSAASARACPSAPPSPSSARRGRVDAQRQRQVEQQRGHHRLGEPAPVAGADEHAVDDEDVPRQRLPERDDDEGGGQGRAHRRVGGEGRRQDAVHGQQRCAEHGAAPHAPADHRRGRGAGPLHVARAQGLAGERLGRDGQRVEGEREEGPHGGGHLVGGERHVPEAGRDPGGDQQDGPQRQRAHEQRYAAQGGPQDAAGMRVQAGIGSPRVAHEHHHEGGRHPGLGDDGAPGRPRDAPAEAVDEGEVEHDVRRETGHRGDQRRAGVLQAAQHTGRGERDEHRRDAER